MATRLSPPTYFMSKPIIIPNKEQRIVRRPIRGYRDTGYLRKKLQGYGILKEKIIGIKDI